MRFSAFIEVCHMKTDALLTAQDLLNLPDDGFHRHELVRGRLLVREPTKFRHGSTAARLGALLAMHVYKHKLGAITMAEGGYLLTTNPDTVRAPDVGFLQTSRVPQGEAQDFYVTYAPDLAVEVLSPSNRRAEINRKLGEYFAGGARLVWIVDPKRQTITVCHSPETKYVLSIKDTLDGEDVLPGFQCPVEDVFNYL